MNLTAGTKLGAYEIRSKIGEGGMGEVYRARDEKLNRDVAIKVLPAAVASDAERLRRRNRLVQLDGEGAEVPIAAGPDLGRHEIRVRG